MTPFNSGQGQDQSQISSTKQETLKSLRIRNIRHIGIQCFISNRGRTPFRIVFITRIVVCIYHWILLWTAHHPNSISDSQRKKRNAWEAQYNINSIILQCS